MFRNFRSLVKPVQTAVTRGFSSQHNPTSSPSGADYWLSAAALGLIGTGLLMSYGDNKTRLSRVDSPSEWQNRVESADNKISRV